MSPLRLPWGEEETLGSTSPAAMGVHLPFLTMWFSAESPSGSGLRSSLNTRFYEEPKLSGVSQLEEDLQSLLILFLGVTIFEVKFA
ncbi:hypothetical protein Q9233_009158 [Columba guinea]|nr:hypothetical protein Q9233_009158 [Columba guinea]